MRAADLARLALLAAIWGASFVFIRVVAPVLGPLWTATGRVAIGGGALLLWFALTGFDARVRAHWRVYLAIGVINCALPFVLFGYAALTLPASYLVVLNSAAPLFAALGAAATGAERLTPVRLAGLAAGTAGVALVSRAGPLALDGEALAAIAASLAAALCYAIAGMVVKRHARDVPARGIAGWSQAFAFAALVPAALAAPPVAPVTAGVLANLAALGLVCSALAYLLYFRLIADLGPTRAMTVTYLMPAFGVAWGVVWLGEAVTAAMLAGAFLVVAGAVAVGRPAPPQVASRP